MSDQENLCGRLLRSEILGMDAYHVQPSTGLVKLDVMENPYDLSPQLKDEWVEKLRQVNINRYPDAAAEKLNSLLISQAGLPDEFGVMLGNGSDELIQIVIQSLCANAGPVLSVSPTFVMYKTLGENHRQTIYRCCIKSGF